MVKISLFQTNVQLTIEDQIKRELSPIKITKQALNKANYMSKRVCELMGSNVELGFFLLDNPMTDAEQDTIIRDVYIGHDQTISGTRCNITGFGRIQSSRDIRDNLKKRIIGWGHSHGGMSTSYSDIDDNTIIDVLKDLGMAKELHIDTDLTSTIKSIGVVKRNNRACLEIITKEGDPPYRIYSPWFDVLDSNAASQIPFNFFRQGDINISYLVGMTFNAQGDEPFRAIAYLYNGVTRRIEGSIGYEVVKEKDGALIDKEIIDQELFERVKNLKKGYDKNLDALRQNYKKAQGYLIGCQQLNREISLEAVYDILRHPKEQLAKLKELHNILNELSDLAEKYNKNMPDSPLLQEQNELAECIINCRDKALRKLASEKSHYSNIIKHISDELVYNRSFFGHFRNKILDELIKEYIHLNTMIDNYLNQSGKNEVNNHSSSTRAYQLSAHAGGAKND